MKAVKTVKTSQESTIEMPLEIAKLDAPRPPKRAPKFLVQGDSNRLRY